MNATNTTEVINQTTSNQTAPVYRKTIGKTTYLVRVHFSETSKETLEDKIKRMLINEIQQMK